MMANVVILFNIVLCIRELIKSHRRKELTVMVWLLILYFSIVTLYSINSTKEHYFGWTNRLMIISNDDHVEVALYMLVSNILLSLGYKIARLLIQLPMSPKGYYIAKNNEMANWLIIFYSALLLLGATLYYLTSAGMSYTDFVEYKGSNWGLVFLYVSASLIPILLLQKKTIPAILVAAIFVFFAVSLTIRSFFLYSLFTAIATIYFAINTKGDNFRKFLFKPQVLIIILTGVVFIGIISTKRESNEALPEQIVVDSMIALITIISNSEIYTDIDSIKHFLWGFIAPFSKSLGIEKPIAQDVQEYFAGLLFGYTNSDTFRHYPSLWYSDSYSSFGWYGILFGLVWAPLLYMFEYLIRTSKLALAIFMPVYIWFVYMLIRGAIGISFLAISYPTYINIAIYIFMPLFFMAIKGIDQKKYKMLSER